VSIKLCWLLNEQGFVNPHQWLYSRADPCGRPGSSAIPQCVSLILYVFAIFALLLSIAETPQ
jgi:hypothetical protein